MLGQHHGIARYTIGQRRGLGPALGRDSARESSGGWADGQPKFVVAIDAQRNAVIVGEERDLLCDELTASEVNWIAIESFDAPRGVTARVRHASRDVAATVCPGGSVTLTSSSATGTPFRAHLMPHAACAGPRTPTFA